ncbi:MAG TPA: hypothetical protein DCK99_05285 [Blastocatellia bacterium]|nr:hypothetical protein [Blastocatellia bacterium]
MHLCSNRFSPRSACVLASLLFVFLFTPAFFIQRVFAQGDAKTNTSPAADIFRLERVTVDGGAELIRQSQDSYGAG